MNRCTVPCLLCLAGVSLLFPERAEAQRHRRTISAQAGLASPKTDLNEVHDDLGVSTRLGYGYRIFDRVELRLDGAFEHLYAGGKGGRLGAVKGPEADLWHVTGGLGIELTKPSSNWEVDTLLGGGITFFNVSKRALEVVDGRQVVSGINKDALTDTALTGNVGLFVGHQVSRSLTLFYRTEAYVMLGDASDPSDYLGNELIFVNGLGLRVNF